MNIAIISGSPRKESISYRLALFLQKHLSVHTPHTADIIDIREWNLPLLQHVFSDLEHTPEKYRPLAEKMFTADAFLLVTPEYNGSYSPSLQNLLDHFPKQPHKTFGIVTASPGPLGGVRASQQLLLLIPGLFGIASPYLLITPFADKKFDADGNLIDPSFQQPVDQFIREFIWLAETVHPETSAAYN